MLSLDEEDCFLNTKTNPLYHTLLFSAVSFFLGLYAIFTTILISKDGTFYIELAQALEVHFLKTISDTGQSPGYPLLITSFHKLVNLFFASNSIQSWILSAQFVSLLSKCFSLIFMYWIGSVFVGSRYSFWGILTVAVLPDSVFFGSDALTDWPNILFLMSAFWFLMRGLEHSNIWMFGLAGVLSGYGYLIRPESGQIVIYGISWVLFLLVRKKMSFRKAFCFLFVLCVGFSMLAVPYMLYKGYVFPERGMLKITLSENLLQGDGYTALYPAQYQCPAIASLGRLFGQDALITNVCETLLYWFVPGLVTGFLYWLKKSDVKTEFKYFAVTFILLNVMLELFQSLYLGFLNRRHTLALVVMTAIYIPVGMQIIAKRISGLLGRGAKINETKNWFHLLWIIGLLFCGAKVFHLMPFRWEKQGYRDTAQWLKHNTKPTDLIAIPDRRITFYAQRIGLEYADPGIDKSKYIVTLSEDSLMQDKYRSCEKVYSVPLNRKKRETVIVYQVRR